MTFGEEERVEVEREGLRVDKEVGDTIIAHYMYMDEIVKE